MLTRSALIYLSRQEGLKEFATRFAPFQRITRRFIAGENIDEAVAAIREINSRGCTASFDHLNESVGSTGETEAEVNEYLNVLARIDESGIAARCGNFVRIDMEGSNLTQATIDICKRLRAEFGLNNVGIVLQSYLYRTADDARNLLNIPARIRLCKGAYDEPPEVAYPEKKDVDNNFVRVMQMLLTSGVYHGIATHDPKMIDATIDFANREGISKDAFEFQMLFGIRRDLQNQLAGDGYGMRVYVPYGKSWYPYFMRRLAERPANIWFVMKNLWK